VSSDREKLRAIISAGMPPLQISGTGTVTPPAEKKVASYDFHYAEFLRRGLPPEEADRLARAVVARDVAPQPTSKE
jgi:hypothetical protein